MKTGTIGKVLLALCLVVGLVLGPLAGGVTATPAEAAQEQAADWDIPGGHLFTQTGIVGSTGFAVTDDNGVLFWSEFQRLGGVNGVGYPVTRRFTWNGFVCQAMQKVIFQWQPDTRSVSFVNVFDIMHDTGKDAWLKTVRQTPEPKVWNEDGLSWDQVVKGRLAVMDNYPAIKAAYLGVPGDPVTMNGLPTTDVVDMGNNYVLRAQRVVLQQWKEDVPWAKAGQVTFGLGGSIAEESDTIPDAWAHLGEKVYTNAESKFRLFHSEAWQEISIPGNDAAFECLFLGEDGISPALAIDKEMVAKVIPPELWVDLLNDPEVHAAVLVPGTQYQFEPASLVDLGGRKTAKSTFTATMDDMHLKGDVYLFTEGNTLYVVTAVSGEKGYPVWHSDFEAAVGSLQSIP